LVKDLQVPGAGVQLWDWSKFSFGKLLNERIKNSDDETEGWVYFADPVDGHQLRVTFSKEPTGDGGTYIKASAIDFRKRPAPLDMNVVNKLPCLDDMLVLVPYNKLKAIYLQVDEEALDSMGHGGSAPAAVVGGGSAEAPSADLNDGWGAAPEEPAKEEPKTESKKEPAKKEASAKAAPAKAAVPDLAAGEKYDHPEHGNVEVVKIKGDEVTIELPDGDIKKVTAASFSQKEETEDAPAPAPAAKAASGKPAPKQGDKVKTAEFGECEVIKVKDGIATLEDKDGELRKVPLDECIVKGAAAAEKAPAKKEPAKKEPAKKEVAATGGDDDWNDDWEAKK
jgi:hypothetical protein